MNLRRYVSPQSWRRFVASRIEIMRRHRGDDALDASWAARGPVVFEDGGDTLVADGLWFNPGYFLRLRLFIEAAARERPLRLLGLLRHRNDWRQRRALERIGFREFVYLRDDEEFPIASFRPAAEQLMAKIRTHDDLLHIALPEDVPASVWYDSVLHKTRNGQPPLADPEWIESLAEILAYIAIYRRILASRRIQCFALSHAWKSEWGSVLWLALRRGIDFYCVTQVSETIRIRRFRRPEDFIRPVEHLFHRSFQALAPAVQAALVQLGRVELDRRYACQTTDINIRYAFSPADRITDRKAARALLAGDTQRPVGIIYGHSWFDYPHIYGMRNFVDFVDWFRTTIDQIRGLDHVTWLLKPHPMETWYGGLTMADMIGDLPAHVRVLPHKTDSLTAMAAADAIISVHGTAGIEAAASGVPVICADRTYYDDWDFAHVATSRETYAELLSRVGRLPTPDAASRDRAAACFACAYGEPQSQIPALRVPCDSLGSKLFVQVREIVETAPADLAAEIDRIAEFRGQDAIDSFVALAFVQAATRQAAQRRVA